MKRRGPKTKPWEILSKNRIGGDVKAPEGKKKWRGGHKTRRECQGCLDRKVFEKRIMRVIC